LKKILKFKARGRERPGIERERERDRERERERERVGREVKEKRGSEGEDHT